MAKLLDKQRYKCALGAMQTVQAIERAIPILHSGPGCAQKLSDGNGSSGYFSPNIFPCTSINEKDVVFALKTASEEMKEIFFNNMSKRMAESVRDDMETKSNVRLKDVEEAQQRIVNLIRKLEAQGEVIINKGGDEDTIIV